MQFGTHFSARKIRRKLAADGPIATGAAGIELLSRKLVFAPIFAALFEHGFIDALPRDQLLETAQVYPVPPHDSDRETERFVAAIPDGYVFSGSGAVSTLDGKFVVESLAMPRSSPEYTMIPFIEHLFRDGPRFTTGILRGDVRSLGAVDDSADLLCPLIPRYQNYYHWTIETLPKLRLLDAFRQESGRGPTLLLPTDPPSWMLESFRILGGDDFPVHHAETSVYQADSTLVPSFIHAITAEEHEWFKRRTARLRDADAGDSTERSRRIYVSRSGARERRVRNDAAVLNALGAYGFESYRLEELPVAEQVRLFADAEVVVGPHGAGLSNIVYSEDIAVVELFGDNLKTNFARIAEAAGFEYHRLQGRQDGPDIQINVSRLREKIEQVVD